MNQEKQTAGKTDGLTRRDLMRSGAVAAAGLAVGFFSGLDELSSLWAEDRRWEPEMGSTEREQLYAGWRKAVTRTFDWVERD